MNWETLDGNWYYRHDGKLTKRLLACGYIQKAKKAELFMRHGVYHVRSCNEDWKSFRTRKEAEKYLTEIK